MNQILKDAVYGMGTYKQIAFMQKIGGMNEEEKRVLEMLHKRSSDIAIEQELNIDRKSRQRIEESVRAKLLLGVFECINHYMEVYEE